MKKRIACLFYCLAFLSACGDQSGPEKQQLKVPDVKMNSTQLVALADLVKEGKLLFKTHCFPCHAMPDEEHQCGNSFGMLFEHLPEPADEYLVKFVMDSKRLRKEGDAYAMNLTKLYDSNYEHSFKDSLSYSQIESILNYLEFAIKLKDVN